MSARILVCDDEAHIVRAAQIKLRKAGYEVFIASDGREGWDAVVEHSPDLVFTDCQMPYMTGLELAMKIKETPETNGLPVLMLTAKGFELSEEVATTKYGIKKIIPKPFSPRALVAEANEILAEIDEANTDKAGTDKAGTDEAGTDEAGTDEANTDEASATEASATASANLALVVDSGVTE